MSAPPLDLAAFVQRFDDASGSGALEPFLVACEPLLGPDVRLVQPPLPTQRGLKGGGDHVPDVGAGFAHDRAAAVDDALGHSGAPVLALGKDQVAAALDKLLGVDVDLNRSAGRRERFLDGDGQSGLFEDPSDLTLEVAPVPGSSRRDHARETVRGGADWARAQLADGAPCANPVSLGRLERGDRAAGLCVAIDQVRPFGAHDIRNRGQMLMDESSPELGHRDRSAGRRHVGARHAPF